MDLYNMEFVAMKPPPPNIISSTENVLLVFAGRTFPVIFLSSRDYICSMGAHTAFRM